MVLEGKCDLTHIAAVSRQLVSLDYKYAALSKRWAFGMDGELFLLFSRYAILEVGSYGMIQMRWSGVGVC